MAALPVGLLHYHSKTAMAVSQHMHSTLLINCYLAYTYDVVEGGASVDPPWSWWLAGLPTEREVLHSTSSQHSNHTHHRPSQFRYTCQRHEYTEKAGHFRG